MSRPKEMELSMQTTYEDGRWHVTIQAWLGTAAACEAMIRTLEIIKPMIAKNATLPLTPTTEPGK